MRTRVQSGLRTSSPSVRCGTSGKVTSPNCIQNGAGLVTSIALASLTLYTGSVPETRTVCHEETVLRVCVVGWFFSIGSSQGFTEPRPRWSAHSGLRPCCVLHRSQAGEGQCAISVGLPRREILLRHCGSQSSVRQDSGAIRASVWRLLRVWHEPGKNRPDQDRDLGDRQWTPA